MCEYKLNVDYYYFITVHQIKGSRAQPKAKEIVKEGSLTTLTIEKKPSKGRDYC